MRRSRCHSTAATYMANPRYILGSVWHLLRGCDPRECYEDGITGLFVCSRCLRVWRL